MNDAEHHRAATRSRPRLVRKPDVHIAVTGSIATDHPTVFPGRFADQLIPGQLDHISLSFLADTLEVRRGGVAANIAVGLARLGLRPLLVGAVSKDFDDYDVWLQKSGVDSRAVRISDTLHTARFMCTTDADNNQIATFYAGAMTEARHITIASLNEYSRPARTGRDRSQRPRGHAAPHSGMP